MSSPSLKEKTAKGLVWGGLSNGIQQLLNLVFGIYLARKLTPDDYGMVGMLTVFSLIAGSLQESGFTAALTNKKNIRHEDYNAVFWFSILVSGSIYLILFFCAPMIADFYETPELTALARYSFLGFFIASAGTAHNTCLYKNMLVKQRSIAIVIGHVLSGCVGVTMAYHGFSYWSIATQNLVYVFTVTSIYWYFSPWHPDFHINFAPLKSLLGFSSKLLATRIFTHINNNIFSIILGKMYSPKEVGFYNQGYKWSSMCGQFLLGMVNNVAQPVFVEVSDERERQHRVFCRMLSFTALVSFPAMLGLALIAKEFIVITIGEKWLPSVPIIQLLCISGSFVPINNLYQQILISKGKSDLYMWNTIAIGIALLTCCLAISDHGIIAMVTGYVIISICWTGIWHYFVWKETGLQAIRAMKEILPYGAMATLSMFIPWLLTGNIGNIYHTLALKIAVAIILYILLLRIFKADMLKECIHYFKRK